MRDLERDVGYGITDSWDEIVEAMDRRAHARTARLMKTEARMSREAWGPSMDMSSRPQVAGGDYRDAGGRSLEAEAVHRDTEAAEETLDSDDRKMAQKRRTTRLNPETTPTATAATTTTVTNAQLQAMIDQGVTAVLAARDANTNDVDSYNSGIGARRNERATRECTYPDFMKCQPLNFKGIEGVVELTQWICGNWKMKVVVMKLLANGPNIVSVTKG
ncbi:hypothetical protein Tco_1388953 [Tanacetum coccineum]